jgi:hypothetical protein
VLRAEAFGDARKKLDQDFTGRIARELALGIEFDECARKIEEEGAVTEIDWHCGYGLVTLNSRIHVPLRLAAHTIASKALYVDGLLARLWSA